jgi:starch synthase
MPSKYEPCGLNQIYSLKYGTIPVVRATGGLDDTIVNYDPATGQGNGFKFKEYDAKEFLNQIKRAIGFYKQPNHWRKLLHNAMSADFSWRRSAEAYLKLYLKALEKREQAISSILP